jgi:deazaflavin-dependent oxidoreductase (nitroreductase family)
MTRMLWILLSVIISISGAAVYVTKALRSEAGRKRLLPLLRPLMHVINPRMVRAIERRRSSFGVVHHSGRRSGRAYHTPVDVGRTPSGVLVPLPYGPETDWCRNVLAAGRCTLTVDGEEVALTAPEVLLPVVAEAQLPTGKLREWRRDGIAHYLSLKRAANLEATATAA